MKLRFYTLLYVDVDEERRLDGRLLESDKRIGVFLNCAGLLASSLRVCSQTLTLLTNDKAYLDGLMSRLGMTLNGEVVQIDFSLVVPRGIRFYSAHFKIDVFRYLSTRPENEYSALLDNDMFCLGDQFEQLQYAAERRLPIRYLLSRYDRGCRGLKLINADARLAMWSGGEFLAGDAEFFGLIYREICRFTDSYFKVYAQLSHQGDEALTSAAIESLVRERRMTILEAGELGLVYRYWSVLERKGVDSYRPFLIHLPSDKLFLSSLNASGGVLSASDFLVRYQRYFRFEVQIKRWAIALKGRLRRLGFRK